MTAWRGYVRDLAQPPDRRAPESPEERSPRFLLSLFRVSSGFYTTKRTSSACRAEIKGGWVTLSASKGFNVSNYLFATTRLDSAVWLRAALPQRCLFVRPARAPPPAQFDVRKVFLFLTGGWGKEGVGGGVKIAEA